MERWPYGHVNDSGNRNMGLRKCRYANTEHVHTLYILTLRTLYMEAAW